LNKLPPSAVLKEAVTQLDEKSVTVDQLNAMLRIWPAQDVLDGLLEEAKTTPAEEKWDKGEEYFISILESQSIK